MIGMWYLEAGKYNVLPIDSRGTLRFAEQRPQIAVDRKKYVYYPGTQMVSSNAAPRRVNVPHSVSVHANVPQGGAEGVLFSMGGNDGGYSFYVSIGTDAGSPVMTDYKAPFTFTGKVKKALVDLR